VIAAREMKKPDVPPIWFMGSLGDWEQYNKVTPKGYDEVSDLLIKTYGIKTLPWQRSRVYVTYYDRDMRFQFLMDVVIVRCQTGEISDFAGGGKPHLPLIKHSANLKADLDPADEGKVLPDFKQEHPNMQQALEASGFIFEN